VGVAGANRTMQKNWDSGMESYCTPQPNPLELFLGQQYQLTLSDDAPDHLIDYVFFMNLCILCIKTMAKASGKCGYSTGGGEAEREINSYQIGIYFNIL
jgi:hypothetical protein